MKQAGTPKKVVDKNSRISETVFVYSSLVHSLVGIYCRQNAVGAIPAHSIELMDCTRSGGFSIGVPHVH